jgi:hypothetical protein
MKFITSHDYLNNLDYVCGSIYNGSNSNENIKQFNIYYKHNKKSELETIKIQTPKLILTNDIIKTNKLVLSMEPFENKIENFFNFIKSIYDISKKNIKNNIKKKKFTLISNFKDNKMFLNITDRRTFGIFDEDKNKISLEHLKPSYEIKLIIEIYNIWFDIEKKIYGINWNIKQIQSFNHISEKCLILDSDEEEDIIKKEIIVQTCLFCNSICSVNSQFYGKGPPLRGKGKGKGKGNFNNEIKKSDNKPNKSDNSDKSNKPDINNIRAVKPTMNITTNDLLDTIKKLKKTKTNNSNNSNNSNTIENIIKDKIEERGLLIHP